MAEVLHGRSVKLRKNVGAVVQAGPLASQQDLEDLADEAAASGAAVSSMPRHQNRRGAGDAVPRSLRISAAEPSIQVGTKPAIRKRRPQSLP